MSEPAAIDPEYVAELERRLASTEAEIARVTAQNTVLETTNISLAEANARLERLLTQARHEKFGPRSEKGDPDQRNLFAEDIEVAEGQLAAAADAADKALGKASGIKKPAKRNKGNLPDHLERIEEVIEPESTAYGHSEASGKPTFQPSFVTFSLPIPRCTNRRMPTGRQVAGNLG